MLMLIYARNFLNLRKKMYAHWAVKSYTYLASSRVEIRKKEMAKRVTKASAGEDVN